MAETKAITYDALKRSHGDEAGALYSRIARIGGFGDVGGDFLGGRPALDISGLSDAKQAQIEKLLTPAAETAVEAIGKSKKEGK